MVGKGRLCRPEAEGWCEPLALAVFGKQQQQPDLEEWPSNASASYPQSRESSQQLATPGLYSRARSAPAFSKAPLKRCEQRQGEMRPNSVSLLSGACSLLTVTVVPCLE